MSYVLNCQLSGWGTVRNPLDESERIPVEDGQVVVDDADLAHALADEYGPLVIIEEPDADGDADDESEEPEELEEPETSDDEDDTDGEDESEAERPTCAGNDGACSRAVDEPGDYCWQHS